MNLLIKYNVFKFIAILSTHKYWRKANMQKLTFLLTALFLTANAPAASLFDLNLAMKSTNHATTSTKKRILYCGRNMKDSRDIAVA